MTHDSLTADDWDRLVSRIVAGNATTDDCDTVQSGLIDGRLLLTSRDQSVQVGRDILQSVVLVGNQRIQIALDEESLVSLRTRVFRDTPGIPPPFPSLLFIGREDSMRSIREHLSLNDKGRSLIVSGWPGVGKTTLLSALEAARPRAS